MRLNRCRFKCLTRHRISQASNMQGQFSLIVQSNEFVCMPASHIMIFNQSVFQCGFLFSADLSCIRTAGVEPAGCWWVDRAWHFSWQDYPCSSAVNVRNWHCGDQSLCVGVKGFVIEALRLSKFNYFAQIHHCYPVAYLAD